MVVFCVLNEKIKRLFKSELDPSSSSISFEITMKKMNRFNLQSIKENLLALIALLELPINERFLEFFYILEQYYLVLKKIILLRAESRYYLPIDRLECYFETGYSIINKAANLSTISGAAALVGGYTLRAAAIIDASLLPFAIYGSWGILVAQLGILVPGLAYGIVAGIIVARYKAFNSLYEWGVKKYKVSKGDIGVFKDTFSIGSEIPKGFRIQTMNSEELMVNCQYEVGYPKYEGNSESHYKEMVLNRDKSNSLSALIISYYTVTVYPINQNQRIEKMSKEDIMEEIRKLVE
jgi:hypothetical protein